ncbi:MAG TPA: hypothetical protein V6D19_05490 [Stenomitos sp.]
MSDSKPFKVMTLPLEKELIIKHFELQIEQCNEEQLKILAKQLHASYIVEQHIFQELLKSKWGFEETQSESIGDVSEIKIEEIKIEEIKNNVTNKTKYPVNRKLSPLAKWKQFTSKISKAIKVLLE